MVAVLGEGMGGHRRGGGATVVTDAQNNQLYIQVDVANDEGNNRSLHIRFRPDQLKDSDITPDYNTILKKWIESVKPDVSQPQVIIPTQLQNPNIDSFVFDIEEEGTKKEHGILIYTNSEIRCYLTNINKLESILDLGTELFVEQPFSAETLMTEHLQRKMTILQSDVDSLDALNMLALSGNTPEPIKERMEIQQQKHSFCGLHSVVNMLITENKTLRNKFTIEAFTDAAKDYISKNAGDQSLSRDLANQFPRLLRQINTLMLIPGETRIERIKYNIAPLFTKYKDWIGDWIKDLRDYETDFKQKKQSPTVGKPQSIPFKVNDALRTIIDKIVDIFDRVKTESEQYNRDVLTFYKTQFSPDPGGNYEIVIIKHALEKLEAAYTMELIDTLKNADPLKNVDPLEIINTRYIMGDGGHYIAVVPYTNSDTDEIRFLRIDSRAGLEVKIFTSWDDLIKPYINAIAVTYDNWTPLQWSETYYVNYGEDGRRTLSITPQTSNANDQYSDFKTSLQRDFSISTQSEWTNIIDQYESNGSNTHPSIQDWFEKNAYDIMNKVWGV